MLRDLLHNAVASSRDICAGEFVDDRPNPRYLSIANGGYRIQSRTLRIPDRLGFFTSGPPPLQVHQTSESMLLVGCVCVSTVIASFLLILLKIDARPNSWVVAPVWAAFTAVEVAMVWHAVCNNSRRAPGYDWGNWKPRRD